MVSSAIIGPESATDITNTFSQKILSPSHSIHYIRHFILAYTLTHTYIQWIYMCVERIIVETISLKIVCYLFNFPLKYLVFLCIWWKLEYNPCAQWEKQRGKQQIGGKRKIDMKMNDFNIKKQQNKRNKIKYFSEHWKRHEITIFRFNFSHWLYSL